LTHRVVVEHGALRRVAPRAAAQPWRAYLSARTMAAPIARPKAAGRMHVAQVWKPAIRRDTADLEVCATLPVAAPLAKSAVFYHANAKSRSTLIFLFFKMRHAEKVASSISITVRRPCFNGLQNHFAHAHD